jgi:hypothetical protein
MDSPSPTPLVPPAGAISIRVNEQELAALEAVAGECAMIQRQEMPPFRRTFLMAAGMTTLRRLITDDMMKDVMALQCSPLGFKTDRDDKGGYPVEVVKEAAIEATLRGLRLVGNEINIIAKRMYAAKDGLRRLVREWPGLTDLRWRLGVPRQFEGFTVVPCTASWKLNGVDCQLDCTGQNSIPVRVNEGGIVDATLGKATRKLFSRIYDVLTGCPQGLLDDDEEPESLDVASEPAAEDQEGLVADLAQLRAAGSVRDAQAIGRSASTDLLLSKNSKATVMAALNASLREVHAGRGERSNGAEKQES